MRSLAVHCPVLPAHKIVAGCSVGCIDAATDYMDPALGKTFIDIAGKPQILSTCP